MMHNNSDGTKPSMGPALPGDQSLDKVVGRRDLRYPYRHLAWLKPELRKPDNSMIG